MTTETNHHDLNEETVTAVAKSLHAHHDRRARMMAGNMWAERKWADLDTVCREEFRDRASEVIEAIQSTDTLDEAANALAMVWCSHGPALSTYVAYASERITETLSDVPNLNQVELRSLNENS